MCKCQLDKYESEGKLRVQKAVLKGGQGKPWMFDVVNWFSSVIGSKFNPTLDISKVKSEF